MHNVCVQLNALDELMCSELQEEGKPDLPSYGMGVSPSQRASFCRQGIADAVIVLAG
eukprot:COSAG02_NODE_54876_length_293_cov_1.474227_1_plen_56_part_10